MGREASGAISVKKKEQPLVECTHCQNHILTLAISYACKNQSIKNFLDNSTSSLPKRQKYFESFLEFYKVDLKPSETN